MLRKPRTLSCMKLYNSLLRLSTKAIPDCYQKNKIPFAQQAKWNFVCVQTSVASILILSFFKADIRTLLNEVIMLHTTGVERRELHNYISVCLRILYKYTGGNGKVLWHLRDFLFISGRSQKNIFFFLTELWSLKSINILHIRAYIHSKQTTERACSVNIFETIQNRVEDIGPSCSSIFFKTNFV